MSDETPTPPAAEQPPGKPVRSSMGTKIVLGCMAVIIGCGIFALGRNMGAASSGGAEIVVIDVSAIVNAQRAVLEQDNAEGLLQSRRVGKIAEDVIRQVAGKNAVILVKQAVVSLESSKLRDITDDVLKELQLPTDAQPTMKIPPVAAALYSEQGQELLAAEKSKVDERTRLNQEFLDESAKKDTLIP